MVDSERWQKLAAMILDAAREGFAMPEEAITWALQITGDQPGSCMATAELWSFLLALEASR